MKNLGIKTKKIVRKITAIASAALMSGLSMGLAAADLSSLTDTFITSGQFDAYVAVGTGGQANVVGFAKDVAGSIVVGAAFAQQATTTTTTSGNATLERNLTTGYLNSSTRAKSFKLWNDKSVYMEWTNADSGFSWLPNQTVSNASQVVANMTGKLHVNDYSDTGYGIKTSNQGTIKLYDKAMIYNLTFQDGVTGYGSGVGKNTTNIALPDGNTYKITGWTNDDSGNNVRITLGDFNTVDATTGTTYDIGDTGATFEITGYSTSPGDKLKVKVLDSTGSQLFHDYVAQGEEIYSCDDFTLNLVEYHTPGGVVDASIEWSTGVLTLEEGNTTEAMTGGENWTVAVTTNSNNLLGNDTNNITAIAFEYDVPAGESYIEIDPGTEIEFFGGYFKLTNEDLSINSTDSVETTVTIKADNDEDDMRFNNENGTLNRFDISPVESQAVDEDYEVEFSWYIGNSSTSSSYKIKCDNSSPELYNLSRGAEVFAGLSLNTLYGLNRSSSLNMPYPLTFIATMYANTSNCIGAKYNITVVNFTTQGGNSVYGNISWVGENGNVGGNSGNITAGTGVTTKSATDFTDGYFNISEPDNNRFKISLDNGTLDQVDYYQGSVQYADKIKSTDDMYYSEYGTKLVRTDGSTITAYYPETNRVAKVALGRSGVKTYELESDVYNDDLDVTLKSAAGSSVQINEIDVGLAMLDSEVTTSTLSKPIILLGGWSVNELVQDLVDAGSINTSDIMADRAMVQMIDSAFNGQDALVIAGWEGDDTRLAAQVVASQVLGTDMGLTGSKAILNTGVTSYSDVTVV